VNHSPDSDLVEQARSEGDKQAFGMLIERYHLGALQMARRMIADRELARELVQEAMLEAYLSLPSLQQPDRFQSWLYGIVLNVCRNHLRRKRYDLLSLEAISGGLEATHLLLVSHEPDPQTMVETHELHELVLSAIDTLSPANRQAILLYYYEQLTLREISMTLGIPMTAVKGRLHKSRRQLKEYFTTFASHEPWVATPASVLTGEPIQERKEEMIEVQIVDVVVTEREKQEHYVIILLDEEGQRILPIWVGNFEGHNITIELLDEPTQRPMTYSFMANLLQATDAVLEEIQISALHEITYYATVVLRVGATTHKIDARPSDAMALALHMKSKIYVADTILERAGQAIPETRKHKPLGKGLEKLATKLAEAKREQEAMLAKLKEEKEQESNEARERLFALVFGEEQ
jgi:RNA polymerase sigma factor (sigma-70 family)